MHLLGPQFTSLSTKKKKTKPKDITAKFAREFREHNDLMRRVGSKQKTIEEYIQYRNGTLKKKLRGVKMPSYTVDKTHRELYPSQDGVGVSFAKTPNMYTGTLVKGISTLHKSNAVPVISEEEMHEHSRMRR